MGLITSASILLVMVAVQAMACPGETSPGCYCDGKYYIEWIQNQGGQNPALCLTSKFQSFSKEIPLWLDFVQYHRIRPSVPLWDLRACARI